MKMKLLSSFKHLASFMLGTVAFGVVSEAFSPPSSLGSIRKRPPSALFYSEHMFVHEDGMPQEQKDELMPCEVQRYGRKNDRVMREDGLNSDAPANEPRLQDLFSPHQKHLGMRPPSKPSSAYVHVHEDGMPKDQKDELMPCEVQRYGRLNKKVMLEDGYNNAAPPPTKVMGASRHQKRLHSPSQPASAYIAAQGGQQLASNGNNNCLPSGGPQAQLSGESQEKICPIPQSPLQQSSVPASAPGPARSPGPPPVGMFLQQESTLEQSSAPTGAPSSTRSPGPPPVGMFLQQETMDIFGVTSGNNQHESTAAPPSSPGPPEAGVFSNQAEPSSPFNQPAVGATGFSAPPGLSNNRLVQRFQEIRQRHMPDTRSSIIVLNTAFFVYHVLSTCYLLMSKKSATIWPNALTGATSLAGQPLLRDWMFTTRLANWQPHRYLTAGFLHSGILHLILNLDSVRNVPGQLERKFGSDVYGTVFMLAIMVGHVGQAAWGEAINLTGASGGIAGLYGLFTVSEFLKTKNDRKSQQQIALSVGKGLGRLFLYGLCLPRMFSNAAHVSGFLAGMASGLFFTLTSSSDDSTAPRKRNTAVMAVWVAAFVALLCQPQLRSAPLLVLRSLFQPGSLTTGRVRF